MLLAEEPLRVLIWASYPALRAGLAELVRDGGFEVAGELSSVTGVEALDIDADVLVASIDAGTEGEVARLAELLQLPSIFIVAAGELRQVAGRDLDAAHGWISRESSGAELVAAIRAVASGLIVIEPSLAAHLLPGGPQEAGDRVEAGMQLTARELDVLRWLAAGLPNKAIALELGISEHTVKFHVGSVLSKLDARSRTEAVTTAARRGLLAL